MLVPLIVLCKTGLGHDEKTFTPGPAISTLPPFEKIATLNELSSAPTDMIVGELAGAPAGFITAGRELSFPAAAMIKQPAARAAVPAAVYDGCGGIGAPSDIEITAHLLAMAQFIPARTCAWVPEPELFNTLPMKICVLKPMP